MWLRALTFAVAAFAASHAAAQETNIHVAAARAIIERAELTDVFEAVEGDTITTRHPASGLTCNFYPGDRRAEVAIFAGLPRGEDVACVRDVENQSTTLYATRYPSPMTPRQALADAVAAIQHRFPDARPSPPSLTMTTEGMPQTHVANYFINVRGERWVTMALVAQSGAWMYKLRFSAQARDEQELMRAELEANAMFAAAMLRTNRAR